MFVPLNRHERNDVTPNVFRHNVKKDRPSVLFNKNGLIGRCLPCRNISECRPPICPIYSFLLNSLDIATLLKFFMINLILDRIFSL